MMKLLSFKYGYGRDVELELPRSLKTGEKSSLCAANPSFVFTLADHADPIYKSWNNGDP